MPDILTPERRKRLLELSAPDSTVRQALATIDHFETRLVRKSAKLTIALERAEKAEAALARLQSQAASLTHVEAAALYAVGNMELGEARSVLCAALNRRRDENNGYLEALVRAEKAEAALREAVGLLRDVQWAGGWPDNEMYRCVVSSCCPECKSEAIGATHSDDCALASFLAKHGGTP